MKQLNLLALLVSVCFASIALADDASTCEINGYALNEAKRGDAKFQYYVATRYDHCGKEKLAFKWYERSAKQGHPFAQNNLGHSFKTGCGVKRNNAWAIYWFRRAYLNGGPLGNSNVARGNLEDYEERLMSEVRVTPRERRKVLRPLLFGPNVKGTSLDLLGKIFDLIDTKWNEVIKKVTGKKPTSVC